jgi:hypothetical protein
MRPNNDSGASAYYYSELDWQGAGSVVANINTDGQTTHRVGVCNDATNIWVGTIEMPNIGYTEPARTIIARGMRSGASFSREIIGYWSSSVYPTTLVFAINAASNFAIGSRVTVWAMR